MSKTIGESGRWKVLEADAAVAREISQTLKISPVVADLLAARGISDPLRARNFLYGDESDLYDPFLLRDMDVAVSLIAEALNRDLKVRIMGDYDADGVTSSAIMVRFFKELGLRCDYYIPHRLEEGYGMSAAALSQAVADGVDLVLTVDCGISCFEEIAFLRDHGVRTIVSDHHEVPPSLPPADAVINPKRTDCPYPFQYLAGAGIAFKICQAVSLFLQKPAPYEYLPLAAVGTVVDVAPLTDENRLIVRAGLKMMESGPEFWPGLAMLIRKTARRKVDARALAFAVGPKINAAGRMGHAARAVELLLCSDADLAADLVEELLALNRERQKVEEVVSREALGRLQSDPQLSRMKVAVIQGDDWHQGVIGITASKMASLLKIPVFVISFTGEKGRGSARGVEGYNIHGILSSNSDLLEAYGGHPAAGGFSIKREHIEEFRKRVCFLEPSDAADETKYVCDREVTLEELDFETVSLLEKMAPFGEGNAEPILLLRAVALEEGVCVGSSHIRFRLRQGKHQCKGIAFGQSSVKDSLMPGELFYDLAIAPFIDTYRGVSSITLDIRSILYPDFRSHRFVEGNQPLPEPEGSEPLLIDSRNVCNRISYLKKLSAESSAVAVLVRTPQQRQCLTAVFEAEEDAAPDILFIKDVGSLNCAEDLVFFAPPPSVEYFSQEICRRSKRIHFLFGCEELEQEAALQNMVRPTVGDLQRLMEAVRELSGKEKEISFDALKTQRRMNRLSMEISFRILSELQIININEHKFILSDMRSVSEDELQASSVFTKMADNHSAFMRFRRLYTRSFESLKSEIFSLFGTGGADAVL